MARKPSQPQELSKQSPPSRAATARVLVVDDDPAVLMILEETLAEAGFDVTSAASGEEAVAACEEYPPDLALLDINMPRMDGIEACQQIRARCGDGFPIVMVTSVDDALSIQSAFEAGASDFILKPINWPLFQRRVEFIMAEWRHASELDESHKRVEALQRVAPEQVMLVSRNGVIIEDLKERSNDAGANAGIYPTLDELYGSAISARFRQCISSVLKTRKTKSLNFKADRWGRERECQADFQVDGRDRVIVVVQALDDRADSPPDEIFRLAFFDDASGLPNEHLFRRVAGPHCVDALLNDRVLAVLSIAAGAAPTDRPDQAAFSLADRELFRVLSTREGVVGIGDRRSGSPFAKGSPLEYLVLLDDVRSGEMLESLVNEIHAALSRALPALGVASGVATLPADGSDVGVLLTAARGARQEAEFAGAPACFHAASDGLSTNRMLDSARELRTALEQGQLELHYQPRRDVRSGAITCVEALLRWNHPIRGYVRLPELLDLAKATGTIFEIGEWVLDSALAAAATWPGGRHAPKVSVNLSRQELTREGIVSRLRESIARHALDPSRLELEITEAALLRARDSVRLLTRLRSLGVGLVLDDFGTGFSSLGILRDYPIDGLKIDASFVRGAMSNSGDASICEIVVLTAQKMGLKAIAEAVETDRERSFLASLGCDEIQGYIVSRPLPADAILDFLTDAALQHQN